MHGAGQASMSTICPVRLAATAFGVIGAAALAAPRSAARAYGIAAGNESSLAYVRATGARDAGFGALLFAVTRTDRAALRTCCWLSAAVAACDAVIVFRAVGSKATPSLVIHGGGALAFAALALLTPRKP